MIDVIMTTYIPNDDIGRVRAGYAIRSAEALQKHLKFSGELRYIISNDGAGNVIADAIKNNIPHHVFLSGKRNGIGSSLNRAITEVDNVWMYTTDDWVPTKDIDLDKAYKLIIERNWDYVKLGPLHPNILCHVKFDNDIGWFLQLHGEGFVFATRPFLATKRFYNIVGPFDEGLNSYETERLYNERALKCAISWAALLSDGEEWNHIGDVGVGTLAITDRA